METQDLPSYIAGYDDYCDTSKPIYSTDDYYEMKEEFDNEIAEKEKQIDNLLDKFSWIKEKIDEIRNKNYIPTKEDIEYIEEIVEEVF